MDRISIIIFLVVVVVAIVVVVDAGSDFRAKDEVLKANGTHGVEGDWYASVSTEH